MYQPDAADQDGPVVGSGLMAGLPVIFPPAHVTCLQSAEFSEPKKLQIVELTNRVRVMGGGMLQSSCTIGLLYLNLQCRCFSQVKAVPHSCDVLGGRHTYMQHCVQFMACASDIEYDLAVSRR